MSTAAAPVDAVSFLGMATGILRRQQPVRVLLIALELFTALGALLGGAMLIGDPSGKRIGFAVQMLQDTPFRDYTVPGIVLLTVNGLVMLAVAVGVTRGWRHAATASMAMGTFLSAWIGVQVFLIGYRSVLQPVMFVTGVLILGTAVVASRSSPSATKEAP